MKKEAVKNLFEALGLVGEKKEPLQEVKLASEEEIKNFVNTIDNKRIQEIETSLMGLTQVLQELIRVERDTQEYLVQLSTSVQEIEHILDTKVIMMSQVDYVEDAMMYGENGKDKESDPLSMIMQKPRKKMLN